jgi:hypothetical protein
VAELDDLLPAGFDLEVETGLEVGFVAEIEPVAGSCANAACGEGQTQNSAKAQPAPNHLRIFARCFCSKGNPLKGRRSRKIVKQNDPAQKQNPTEAGIVIILHRRRQRQFRLGYSQVTEVSRP